MSSEELVRLLRRLRRPKPQAVSLAPDSPFDALLEERLKGLERQVDELKGRVNGLIFMVVGAVIVEVVIGLLE